MMRDGLIKLTKACIEKRIEAFPVLTIHDEIIFECKNAHLKTFAALTKEILSHPEGWNLEFPVDLKVSTTTFEEKAPYKEAA
jgi:DNA polymerase I-like protein with 3'-5' exonuclease and polymerase domains